MRMTTFQDEERRQEEEEEVHESWINGQEAERKWRVAQET
jgi:hypothetical protein